MASTPSPEKLLQAQQLSENDLTNMPIDPPTSDSSMNVGNDSDPNDDGDEDRGKRSPVVSTTAATKSSSSEEQASWSLSPKSTEEVLIDDYGFVYKRGAAADQMASAAADRFRFSNIKDMGAYRKTENKWVKQLCRRGIPESVRGRVWQLLSGSIERTKPGLFDELRQRPDLPIYDVIRRDINRCYPDHSFFRSETSQGQRDLFDILKAYAHYNSEIGYCQGMGRLVGMMLMQVPAEDSFWLLVATVDQHLSGYYTTGLDRLRMHAMVFEKLLYKHFPKLAKHLEKNDISPLIYMTQWFLTIYTMTLPWPSVLRIWDMFYCDGIKVLFRVGLGIMSQVKDHLLKNCPSSTEILEFLLHIPFEYLEADRIVKVTLNISVGKKEIEALEAEAAKAWNDAGSPTRGTLTLTRKR